MSGLIWSEILNRYIRKGDWDEQKIPTYTKILTAIERGDSEEAVQMTDYFIIEAKVCYDLYVQWINLLQQYITEHLGSAKAQEAESMTLAPLSREGKTFNPKERWEALLAVKDDLRKKIEAGQKEEATELTEKMREQWRLLHDLQVDWVYGYLNYISNQMGEEEIEKVYRFILVPFFDKRYERFNPYKNDWNKMLDTLLYLSCEAMRGHLCGPKRIGEFEMWEEEDRWVFAFNPCGSGGRTMRGEPQDPSPPRMQPPYNYKVTEKEHPWAWSKKGACYYCIHCCMLMEVLPIEKWGYPVRVVETPTYPDRAFEKCRWYVYKDLDKIPEEFYIRLGKTKPKPQPK